MLTDGMYVTHPLHGPANVLREIVIRNGIVYLNGIHFGQEDFFRVNVLVTKSN